MRSFRIGSIRGIEIGIHPTWLFAFLIITWSLASGAFPSSFPGWSTSQYWVAGAAASMALFASVLVHELAHSFTARRLGHEVQGITLFIFGGVSRISGRTERPLFEFLVAFAGPAASVILGIAAFAVWKVVEPDPFTVTPLGQGVLFYVAWMNVALGIFNLLPGHPLDGGRVLHSAVWGLTGNTGMAGTVTATVGRFVALGLMAYGVFMMINGSFLSGAWMAFIGWFLLSSGSAERRAERVHHEGLGFPVAAVMQPVSAVVESDMRLDHAVNTFLARQEPAPAPVSHNGEVVGFISMADARRVPYDEWSRFTVKEAMPKEDLHTAQPYEDAGTALSRMESKKVRRLLVLEQDRLTGVVSREDVEQAIVPRENLATVRPPNETGDI